MINYTLVGDIHGDIDHIKSVCESHPTDTVVQIGDFGFREEHSWADTNLPHNGRVLFGNHDYYPYLNRWYSLGNWYYDNTARILFIRGAYSIDRVRRYSGIDYFENEELSFHEIYQLFDFYKRIKPKIVVSHDGPQDVIKQIYPLYDHSMTRMYLSELCLIHKPEQWYFGHHHISKQMEMGGCQFRCLAEKEVVSI